MKNNKGFAITTMVYGLIILSSLILFLTLSIMDTSNLDNDNYTDDIEQELLYCYYSYKPDTKICSLKND